MKYACDFYDDPRGEVLKDVFPHLDDVPDLIKTAECLTPEQRTSLPDDVYALVMRDDRQHLRKFACVDAGNVALSVIYFSENQDQLPVEAQKVAAANLLKACSWYGLRPPQHLVATVEDPDELQKTSGVLRPHIDVTGMAPPPPAPRPADHFALVKEGQAKYPLDTAVEVDAAVRYFLDKGDGFDPHDRHLYCIKTAARAADLGIPVPEPMQKYGSVTFDHPGKVKVAVLSRMKFFAEDAAERDLLREMATKHAEMPPELFASMLEAFDRDHGLHRKWDGGIQDPYWSTFGVQKTAAWSCTGKRSGKSINEDQLRRLASSKEKVAGVLGLEIAEGLADDPVTVFSSLPDPHKEILINMAA